MTFKKLFKKVAAVLVAGATVVAMAVPAFAADTEVWTGSVELGSGWTSENDAIPGSAFANVNEGDTIVLKITPAADASEAGGDNPAQVKVAGNHISTWAEFYYTGDAGSEAGKTEIIIPISADFLNELKTTPEATVAIQGKNATVTALVVRTADTNAGGSETAGSSTGDSANVGLILAVAAAVVAVGATVVLKKRETVER